MPQVELDEQVYKAAERRAAEGGYASVGAYITGIIVEDAAGNVEDDSNFDHLFTPERIAEIDEGLADIRAGRGYTLEQAQAELAKCRAEWRQEKPR